MAKHMGVINRWLGIGRSTLARQAARQVAQVGCGFMVAVGLWLATLAPALALPTNALVAYLPPGNAITEGRALLRYSLPIDNPDIRTVQQTLEGLSEWLRSKRWGPISKDLTKVERTLTRGREAMLAAVPDGKRAAAISYLDDMQAQLIPMREAVELRDRETVWLKRVAMLDDVSRIEELMVQGFPFEVPAEYSHLPQLKGRATVEMTTAKGNLKAVIDGYSAPVTGGNFIDLVQRGFYDGLEFTRAEDNYVLQTGDPAGSADGFIDPKTQEYRAIPLEILVKDDDEPVYGTTLEEIGRFLDKPVLPFSAFGTLGMARPNTDPNGGSSQFFFFLFEAEMTPAGLNLLDGRYAVFGYVVENKELLEKLTAGDRIDSIRVISGANNLVQPG